MSTTVILSLDELSGAVEQYLRNQFKEPAEGEPKTSMTTTVIKIIHKKVELSDPALLVHIQKGDDHVYDVRLTLAQMNEAVREALSADDNEVADVTFKIKALPHPPAYSGNPHYGWRVVDGAEVTLARDLIPQ